MGLLDRLFGGKRAGGGSGGADVDGALQTLVMLYDSPDVKSEGGLGLQGRQPDEVRSLGRSLHKGGGKEAMVAARDGLRERLPWATKNLEAIWASLPEWRN
jgi:hypothetical protein